MCFAVYIGSNQKLETSSWIENETVLNFQDLSNDDEIVKGKFTKPYVYYVGADTGCSCGFAWEVEDFNDPDEQDSKKSPQALIDFIKSQTRIEDIELYCCWEGDWSDPIGDKITIDIKDVSLDKYYFMEEKRFVIFNRQQKN
jgi:hypothetical protein